MENSNLSTGPHICGDTDTTLILRAANGDVFMHTDTTLHHLRMKLALLKAYICHEPIINVSALENEFNDLLELHDFLMDEGFEIAHKTAS